MKNFSNDLSKEIILTHTLTARRLLKEGSNGTNAFTLYNFYCFCSSLQETKSVYATDSFCMAGLNWGRDKFRKAKKLLVNMGIIESVTRRDKLGKIAGHYIYIHYISHRGSKPTLWEKPQCGKQPTNAIDKNINTIDKNINAIPFIDFWNLYDKKVGNKHKIEKKWNKLRRKDQEAILKYVPKYKEAQPEKRFRKNPETFLNNKSWEDEIISSAKPKKKKVYFNGNPVVEKQNGQKYVISNGEWLEYTGSEKELETKWE
jgi:hypothetical protein